MVSSVHLLLLFLFGTTEISADFSSRRAASYRNRPLRLLAGDSDSQSRLCFFPNSTFSAECHGDATQVLHGREGFLCAVTFSISTPAENPEISGPLPESSPVFLGKIRRMARSPGFLGLFCKKNPKGWRVSGRGPEISSSIFPFQGFIIHVIPAFLSFWINQNV